MSSSLFSWRGRLRGWCYRYLIALCVATLVVTGAVVAANVTIDAKFNEIERVEVELQPLDPGESGNFLIIGSDTRQFEEPGNQTQLDAFGDPAVETGQRSDTIMVVHVEPGERTSLVVSFPRDLWVDIPGLGDAKINAAFNQGPQAVIDTLEANFGIPIHHYIEVDFASFEGIVNAVGRVPVFLPAEARDTYTGFSVPSAGCYRLDGAQALQYVRSRSLQYRDAQTGRWEDANAIPDFGRIERQQEFIRRMGSLAYQEALTNPLTANRIANDVIPQLRADDTLARADVFKLVKTFRTVDPADPTAVEMITLPSYGATSSDGQSILLPDQPDADAVIDRLKTLAPAPAPTPAEVILPAQVNVRILNGTDAAGLASSTLDALQREFGFAGAGFGNAAATPRTEIRYLPGLEDAALLVQSYLGGSGRLVERADIPQAEVVVVLGDDFEGVSAPGDVVAAPTTAPTTTVTLPDDLTYEQKADLYLAALEAACVP